MHMNGLPHTMQQQPSYDNVTTTIYDSFSKRLHQLNQIGVCDVILDVGFGFGKNDQHNYQLLKQLAHFKSLQRPILVGVSRKSMIQRVINKTCQRITQWNHSGSLRLLC